MPQQQTTYFNHPVTINLLSNLPVAVCLCDKTGRIQYFNPAAAALWGKAPNSDSLWCGADKVYNPAGVLLKPDEYPAAKALNSGLFDEQEIIIQQPDGSLHHIIAHPSKFTDDDGQTIGVSTTLVDVTEQKNDENRQARLAAIVESSEDAVISKTLEGIITSWNQSAEKLFGFTESEAIGRHISILIPDERLDEETMIIGKVKNNERMEHFETIRRTKLGNQVPISLTVSPIRNKSGQVIGASKIARDISRQKKFEERLQRYAENLEILNNVGEVISADLDIQNILQKVTDATTQLTGAQFGAFFHNHINQEGESYMLYTLSGAPREAFEKFGMPRNTNVFAPTFTGQGVVRVDDITKDPRYGHNTPHKGMPKGHLPVVSYLAVPVIAKTGDVIGGLFYGHSTPAMFTREHEKLVSAVAAQAAVALDNAKLYEEVKTLNDKKDEFIGLASHELRTPLTSISGYLQLIERNLLPDDKNKTFIKRVVQQTAKLGALISDLLDVSKIQTGELPLACADFYLGTLLTETVENMQQANSTHQLNVELPDAHLLINADRQRIEQVLTNLIANAIKYSPGQNRVDIKVTCQHDKVQVAVQDYGIGIEKNQLEKIFSRFYRVENPSLHISGLGIGLYLCFEIINRHKGKLWVNSTPGEGSTFYFELPLKQS